MERTLIILKPDAVQRQLIGEIINRIERKGLQIVACKLMHISESLARQHYAVWKDKPFYGPLVDYMASSPVMVLVLQAPAAIAITRKLIGQTFGSQAQPGTIRGDLACAEGVYNLIHASDSPEAAQNEIKLFFTEQEILNYQLVAAKWLYAPK